jgi:uncharacterized protein (TIGR03437 family)
VLNPEGSFIFQLNPDNVASIYVPNCCQSTDSPFSPTENVAHFDQNVREFLLPRDNATWWYESQMQINFSLPPARRPGDAFVYVTDARGIDSNGQPIRLTCADCPEINSACGVYDLTYQTLRIEPGYSLSVNGSSFSSSGNTVIVEQRETGQTTRRWTLPRESLLSESPNQINVKLPNDLGTDRDTLLYVKNANGRESNEVSFTVSEPCQECEPRLKPCQAISGDTGDGHSAGAAATITGRFTQSGNKVIVEQVDQVNSVYRYTITHGSPGWSETDKRIQFTFPLTLFAGRALFYVVDSDGHESRAQEVTILPTTVTSVSAANYQGPKLASDSIVAAFSTAMATTTQSAGATPLPTELAGTRVIVRDSANAEFDAPLFFVSPTQINFQLPPGLANGSATATFLSGFGATSTGIMQIVGVSPGLFSADSSGKGVAAAVVVRVKAGGSLVYERVAVFDQAQNKFVSLPIDLGPPEEEVFLVLFGTGFRARSSLSAVSATIGGISSEVVFAGPQLEFVSLDQLNVRLPRALAGKGEVEVAASIDGQSANVVTVKVK